MHTTTASPTDTARTSVAAILEDAALYIDSYGWCQGSFHEPVPGTLPRACALGAIHAVAFKTVVLHAAEDYRVYDYRDHPDQARVACRAVGYLADFLDDGIWREDDSTPAEVIWKFNDDERTTQDLVTHALRAAAKRARVELGEAVTP